jgi:hypothetical protein
MDDNIACPQCGAKDWKAVEQFTALTPCVLIRESDGSIGIEFDMRAELARDAATSVVLAYTCANEECGHTVQADALAKEVQS